MPRTVQLGILGLGTVGSGLVELIRRNASLMERKSDLSLCVRKVLVKDREKPRSVTPDLITYDPEEIFNDPDIDIVVEVIGGIDPAREYLLRALRAGKSVVTANKALLAAHGVEIFEAAAENKCQIGIEASVAGGIPIIRALSSGLIANEVEQMLGILNGTSNFLLTRMQDTGVSYEEALKEAQAKGLAEADPTFDVQGIDAAHKLTIVSEVVFQTKAELDQIIIQGIDRLEQEDFATAAELGYVIKPVAFARRWDGNLDLRVHPAMLPKTHPLAGVRDEFNALLVQGDAIGEMMFYGKGAGSLPTASAVLSDIIEVGRMPYSPGLWNPTKSAKVKPLAGKSRFYLRFPIFDKPGIIGRLATALGDREISISNASAKLVCSETNKGNVMIVTHLASEEAVRDAVASVKEMDVLTADPIAIRILADDDC